MEVITGRLVGTATAAPIDGGVVVRVIAVEDVWVPPLGDGCIGHAGFEKVGCSAWGAARSQSPPLNARTDRIVIKIAVRMGYETFENG